MTIEYDESITDEGITKTFSDLTNPNFPVPQNIDIKILSKNVKFSCNLSTCEVLEGNSSTPINLLINTIRIEHDGTYSLSRMTGKRVNYTTAPFTLTVTGNPNLPMCRFNRNKFIEHTKTEKHTY